MARAACGVLSEVRVIASEDGKKILPSFVALDDSGHILVGEAGRNQYLVYPERTIKSIKRSMGQDTRVTLGDHFYTPQRISAIILKRLKTIAEQDVGRPIGKAVITVPAYFSDAQRQATREAGEIAGLQVVRIIHEPTAAALVYGAHQTAAQRMLVYDLGGGTFDVSVVNVQHGVVEVLASQGDNHLGGDDFDQQIIDYLVEHLETTHSIDVRAHPKAMARIARAAENAKHLLSDQPYVQIEEEYLLEHDSIAIHLSVELSRADYEGMIADYIDATMNALHIALKGAKLTVSDIDEIILVGGATRTPCIRERLFDEFGFEPHGEVDLELFDTVLIDVTPYTYGTSALWELHGEFYLYVYAPIIHKNSVLPIRKTEAFMTTHNGQEAVIVNVYQGEDPDALKNVKIGEFRVEGLRSVEAGNIIILTLDLDLNGILRVSTCAKATALEKSITIQNALSRIEGDALDTAKQRITQLFGSVPPVELFERPVASEITAARIDRTGGKFVRARFRRRPRRHGQPDRSHHQLYRNGRPRRLVTTGGTIERHRLLLGILMECCPCCHARLNGPRCGRGQTDLSLILATEHAARFWLIRALRHWQAGEPETSVAALETSLQLHPTLLARAAALRHRNAVPRHRAAARQSSMVDRKTAALSITPASSA